MTDIIQPHIHSFRFITIFSISLHHADVLFPRTSLVLLVPYVLRPWRCFGGPEFWSGKHDSWFLPKVYHHYEWWNYTMIIISLLIIISSYTCKKPLLVINARNIKLFCSKMRRGWVSYLSCCGGPGFAMENLWRPPNDVADLKLWLRQW